MHKIIKASHDRDENKMEFWVVALIYLEET